MAAIIEGDTLVKRFGEQISRPGYSMIRFSCTSHHQAEKGAYRDLERQPAPLTFEKAIKQTNQLLAQGRMAPFFRSHLVN